MLNYIESQAAGLNPLARREQLATRPRRARELIAPCANYRVATPYCRRGTRSLDWCVLRFQATRRTIESRLMPPRIRHALLRAPVLAALRSAAPALAADATVKIPSRAASVPSPSVRVCAYH